MALLISAALLSSLGCSSAEPSSTATPATDGGANNPPPTGDGGSTKACAPEASHVIGAAPASGDVVLIGVSGDSKGPVALLREGEELVVRRVGGERTVVAKVATSSYTFAASIAARPDGTACVAYATPDRGLGYACGPDFVGKDSGLVKVTDGKSVALAESRLGSVAFVYGRYASIDAFVRETDGTWTSADPNISSVSIPWSATTHKDAPFTCMSFSSRIGIVGPRSGGGDLDDLAYGDAKPGGDGRCTIASNGKELVVAYTNEAGDAVVGTYDPMSGEKTFTTSVLEKTTGTPLLVSAPSGNVDVLLRASAGGVVRYKRDAAGWGAGLPVSEVTSTSQAFGAWVDGAGGEHVFSTAAKDIVYGRSCR